MNKYDKTINYSQAEIKLDYYEIYLRKNRKRKKDSKGTE